MASRSRYPSFVTLPPEAPENVRTIYDFFCSRFSMVTPGEWEKRFSEGVVLQNGKPLSVDAPFLASRIVQYYREVESEPDVPKDYAVLDEAGDWLAADKPHGLPVVPSGPYVRNTLLHCLRDEFDNPDLTPLHRLDRDTAGVVLFSKTPNSRGPLGMLFESGKIQKEYLACVALSKDSPEGDFSVENRMETGESIFKMRIALLGKANARTTVFFESSKSKTVKGQARVRIRPWTGKKHQIRLHLASMGCPIVGDPIYGVESREFPLQLLARSLKFIHPVSGKEHQIRTGKRLKSLDFKP